MAWAPQLGDTDIRDIISDSIETVALDMSYLDFSQAHGGVYVRTYNYSATNIIDDCFSM